MGRKKILLLCGCVVFVVLTAVFGLRWRQSAGEEVPILLYHHIDEEGEGNSCIQTKNFLAHLDALAQAGYSTVSPMQLIDYVQRGTELPDKPILITFDDGYRSNYEIAYPALVQRGMKATIFMIGVSAGKDTYKDTGKPMIPHFSYEQAKEMVDSGLISVQSHTYDLHQYGPLEPDGGRNGMLPMDTESQERYLQVLREDLERSILETAQKTGEPVTALAYPVGLYNDEIDRVCDEVGLVATFTIEPHPAVLRRGHPESLRRMGRYYIDDISAEELLKLIE